MADTVITNTPGSTRSADEGAGAIGWAVGLILVIAAVVAGFIYFRNNGVPAPVDTNINVTVPGASGGADTSGGGGTTN